MFAAGTILELKKKRDAEPKRNRDDEVVMEKDPKTGNPTDKPVMENFPYNRVEVVGPSPVVHVGQSDWTGTDAEGVIIRPLSEFGGNLDEPIGKIRQLYNVISTPEAKIYKPEVHVVEATTAMAGPTPEEVFAREAPGKPPKRGQPRGRTPFEGVKPSKGTHGTSPL
jgi:hypothetical protein